MTHPLIVDYATRHRITLPGQPFNRLTVIVDEKYRVHLHSASDGTVVLSSKLTHLPPPGSQRNTLLEALGRIATGTLMESSASCAVDHRETALWLQQMVPQGSVVRMDDVVGRFVNDLSFWTSAIKRLQ